MPGGVIVGDSGLSCCGPAFNVRRQLFERSYFPLFVDWLHVMYMFCCMWSFTGISYVVYYVHCYTGTGMVVFPSQLLSTFPVGSPGKKRTSAYLAFVPDASFLSFWPFRSAFLSNSALFALCQRYWG